MTALARLLCLVLLIGCTQARSVWEAIEASTEPIGKFKALIKSTASNTFLATPTCTSGLCPVVFIPTDAAFTKAFPSGEVTGVSATDLVKNHICTLENKDGNLVPVATSVFDDTNVLKTGTDIGFGQFIKLRNKIPVDLYWVRKKNSTRTAFFINNAELTTVDKKETGGVYHIISSVLMPVGQSKSAFDYLTEKSTDYSDFLGIFNALKAEGPNLAKISSIQSLIKGTARKISSVFIPVNTGFASMATEVAKLKNNQTQLLDFIVGHVAYDQIVFMSWMKNQPKISLTMKDQYDSPSFNATMYSDAGVRNFIKSGGVTATIRSEAQPLTKTLFFSISEPLNFVHNTIEMLLQTRAQLFLTACKASVKCYALLTSAKATVFAPTTAMPAGLNRTMMDKLLLLHIIPNEQLSTPEMKLGMKKTIADSGVIRFTPVDKNMLVEARMFGNFTKYGYKRGYVGGRVQTDGANLPATNGIVHLLPYPLGQPRQSIFAMLEDKSANFSQVVTYLRQLDSINLNIVPTDGRHYTFFAPTNAAFAKMTDAIGQKILNNKDARNQMLRRLILLSSKLMSDLTPGTIFQAVTAQPYYNDKYKNAMMKIQTKLNIKNQIETIISDVGAKAEVSISHESSTVTLMPLLSEWGCTNGILYSIDAVPYTSASVGKVCKPGTTCGGGTVLISGAVIALGLSLSLAAVTLGNRS